MRNQGKEIKVNTSMRLCGTFTGHSGEWANSR